ncbi:MAG: aspartyl protease family protein [Candidatus Eremiobacteraeota bacterium]|nr:aspartyl protease family protein [Candidatus Eremiobacteraeota bacterium]
MATRLWRLSAALLFLSAQLAVVAPASFAAAPAKAPAPDPRAWPTAYETTSTTLKDVLDASKRAEGRIEDESARTLRVAYVFHDGGLDGTEREVWRGDDYRIDMTMGPFLTAEGRYKDQLWETNENGYTLLKRGIHKRAEANVRALDKPDPGDDVKLLGRLRAPADVYVVRVAPADGREERRFYDATSFYLVRRETAYLGKLVVTTYEDYRTQNGVSLPFRITLSDGHPENDKVWTTTSLQIGTPVQDAELAIPGSRRLPVVMPAGVSSVRLPARVDPWGRIIVRLTVNGRGLDFQLDSGSSSIVLNRDVVRELNLKRYGRWSTTVAGSFTSGYAVVPKIEIGQVTMNDVIVEALPFSFENDERTRVVGLLGYDFIAGCVVKIDYVHGTVDAIPSESFHVPENAFVLDAALDDNVPMIGMTVNDAFGDRFVLDTGADDVVVFSGFASKHPAAVEDHSPKKILSRTFNIVSANGVGGRLLMRPVLIQKLHIGQVQFPDWLAFVMTGNQQAFEGEEADGLVGAWALNVFDVYLDYANSRVVLVPNSRTRKTTPAPAPSAPPPAAKPSPAPTAAP